MSLHEKIFLASGTWLCPAGVTRIELEGCGGGGGGGAGHHTTNATNLWSAGGSGGGGALLCKVGVVVIPNTLYDITIGAGGTGGTAPNDDATAGGNTRFELSGSYKAIFSGAGRGQLGGGTTGSQLYYYKIGGLPVNMTGEESTYSYIWLINTGDIVNYIVRPISSVQNGGFSVGTNDTSMATSGYGGHAPVTLNQNDGTAGAPGTQGSDGGLYRGGGSGGGGGAGAYQLASEGNGGAGGNGNNGGVGANGVAGSSCSANTGGGGGGGGACGYGSGGRGNAAAGGNGGSGKLIIRWNT